MTVSFLLWSLLGLLVIPRILLLTSPWPTPYQLRSRSLPRLTMLRLVSTLQIIPNPLTSTDHRSVSHRHDTSHGNSGGSGDHHVPSSLTLLNKLVSVADLDPSTQGTRELMSSFAIPILFWLVQTNFSPPHLFRSPLSRISSSLFFTFVNVLLLSLLRFCFPILALSHTLHVPTLLSTIVASLGSVNAARSLPPLPLCFCFPVLSSYFGRFSVCHSSSSRCPYLDCVRRNRFDDIPYGEDRIGA